MMMGINDIGWPRALLAPAEKSRAPTTSLLAYRQIIARAHAHGISHRRDPDAFRGLPGSPPLLQRPEGGKRQAVNKWIRAGGAFDGVIDFDRAPRPGEPQARPADDSGDHLHPNDAGYKAMANSIDLGLLGVSAP